MADICLVIIAYLGLPCGPNYNRATAGSWPLLILFDMTRTSS